MTRWPLAPLLLLAFSLALPAIALAAPLGPLDVPHVSQWDGGGASGCTCAAAVMILRAYTGEIVTPGQCCAEVGCPAVADGPVRDWLKAHGVPMATSYSTRRSFEEWLIANRHPFLTIQQFGRVPPIFYHSVLVVGFDAAGDVWLHNPSSAGGPELWGSENYEATRWRTIPAEGNKAWVMYPLYQMPVVAPAPWRAAAAVVAVAVDPEPEPKAILRGSWRLIDPRIMEAIQ